MASFPKTVLLILLSSFLFVSSSVAQVFTTIVDDYACAQFPNGAQYLTRVYPGGYALVKTSEVKARYNKERKILKQKISLLNEKINAYKKSRLAKSKLIGATNKIIGKLFKDGSLDKLPNELPADEAELQVENVKARLQQRDRNLQLIKDLINNCEAGINPKTGKGTVIGVVVEPISMASSNTIYGGFVLYSSKLKNSGFNVCLKLIYPDGSVGKLYTGFGDDYICGTGTLKFEGIPQSVCKQVVPTGQVGYVIQKRTYAFTSLPDRSTEQLIQDMKLEVQQDKPAVAVLRFPFNLSRDASIKACDAF